MYGGLSKDEHLYYLSSEKRRYTQLLKVKKKEDIPCVKSTVIRGGPIDGILVLFVVSRIQRKKVCQLGKTISRSLYIEVYVIRFDC